MLSLPRAPSTKAALRQQLADHMFELASDIRWQQSLRNLEAPEEAASALTDALRRIQALEHELACADR